MSNYSQTIYTLEPITATVTSPDISGQPPCQHGHVIFTIDTYTSGGVTPHLQGKDPASGAYYDILIGPDLTSTGVTILKVGPGISPSALGSAADFLPEEWRVQLVADSGTDLIISVGVNLCP